MQIKVCGITTLFELEILSNMEIDYVGFVFADVSKRRLSINEASILSKTLGSVKKKVGVFVNWDVDNVKRAAEECHLDVLQFHGDESPEYCRQFQQEKWKAIRVKDEKSLDIIHQFNDGVNGFVFDCYYENSYGGMGKIFNWSLMEGLTTNKKVILAGGLNPHNIRQAIKIVRPDCVDVSTGVESDSLYMDRGLGKKDKAKLIDFIAKARRSMTYE